jgi:hypothetical protein
VVDEFHRNVRPRPDLIQDGPLVEMPVECVLGRDARAQCLLRYDGFHGRFDLAILGP